MNTKDLSRLLSMGDVQSRVLHMRQRDDSGGARVY